MQGAVDQEILDHAHLPQGGDGQGEADGEAALGDVGPLDHGPGRGIGGVVDGRAPGPRVDAGLVRAVGGQSPVPVQVIGSEVEAGRGQRTERAGGVELEAGQLDGHGIGPALQDRGDRGGPDVAHGRGVEPRRRENGGEHADRGGLAVGPRHDDPGHLGAGGPLQAPGELDLAPHPGAVPPSAGQDRSRGRHSRGDDEQIWTALRQRVGQGGVVADGDPLERRRHGIGRVRAGVEQVDARAEVGQRLDDGEPGAAGADDADTGPGEVLEGDGVGGSHW